MANKPNPKSPMNQWLRRGAGQSPPPLPQPLAAPPVPPGNAGNGVGQVRIVAVSGNQHMNNFIRGIPTGRTK